MTCQGIFEAYSFFFFFFLTFTSLYSLQNLILRNDDDLTVLMKEEPVLNLCRFHLNAPFHTKEGLSKTLFPQSFHLKLFLHIK